jgi:hypothetical protein
MKIHWNVIGEMLIGITIALVILGTTLMFYIIYPLLGVGFFFVLGCALVYISWSKRGGVPS